MKLMFIRKTAQSGDSNCPALYATDRGTFVVQGRWVNDAEALASVRDLGDDETLVEVPADVLAEIAVRPASDPAAQLAPLGGRIVQLHHHHRL